MVSSRKEPSIADPTPADSYSAQALFDNTGDGVDANMVTTAAFESGSSDSDSDVSMSADTEDEEESDKEDAPATQTGSAPVLEPPALNTNSSGSRTQSQHHSGSTKKRKHSDSFQATPNGQLEKESCSEVRKRIKPEENTQPFRKSDGHLPEDKSLLPAEIWQHTFTFCHPKVLGISLQVNKLFNAYLDPSSRINSIVPLSKSTLLFLQPDAIWRASRNGFKHGMPGPLLGKSELDMWKLACGISCQFCGKKSPKTPPPTDQWHPGPGENGIARIWSFGIISCGSCLLQQSTKEIDLLLSSTIPSLLLVALTFVFFTNELHIIPPSALQGGAQPPSIQIAKRYFNAQIQAVKNEFENAKALGTATAEEWMKGLDQHGKERRNDPSRWERWEATGGVTSMRRPIKVMPISINGQLLSVSPMIMKKEPDVKSEPLNSTSPLFRFQPVNPLPQKNFPSVPTSRTPQSHHPSFSTNVPPRFDSPSQSGFMSYPPSRAFPQPRHERTKDEVVLLKAARRTEIERRCMLLDPPLTPGVLAHMPSFQASIQIIQPLSDSAWDVLKPRLLSQREEAEQRENDRLAQTRVVQERFDDRKFQDSQIRSDSKDPADMEWDDYQAPLRARIGGYADEIIRDGWNAGEKVNYENCPKFAADVLIYVRKRFYAEVAKDEAAARATGQEPEMDPPNGPFLRKLILENMKWVFDTKIKPHTEEYRRELFLCNACDLNTKYYGFEGVIQHYAAKHTNALSMGSIVVHWKSEWPEYPLFNPDPTAAVPSNSYYSTAPSASAPYASNGPVLQQSYGYNGYQPASVSNPMPAPIPTSMAPGHVSNPHGYQEGPGPYYGHTQFGEQYSEHQNGPYQPPQSYTDGSQGYQAPHYPATQYSAPPSANGGYEASQEYPQQGFGGSYPTTSQGMYPPTNHGLLYPPTIPEVPAQQVPYNPQGNQYGQTYNPPPTYPPVGNALVPQRTEEYKAQLVEVAKNTREIWNTINPMKEVQGSVKVYTIIYHLLKKNREVFQDDPPLAMIIDGLSNNKEMRPIRNINGLLCKACTLGMAGSKSASQKKHYSFPQLLNHFRLVHEEGVAQNGANYFPDWKIDMVELPDRTKLTALMDGPNKDDKRFKLIIGAIPEFITRPTPQLEDKKSIFGPAYGEMANNPYPELAPSRDNHDKYNSTLKNGKQSDIASVPHDNGEYDPRNPCELSMESLPAQRAVHQNTHSRDTGHGNGIGSPRYKFARQDDQHEPIYRDRVERPYEPRPVSPSRSIQPINDYDHVVIRETAPIYIDRRPRYREAEEPEYVPRLESAPVRPDNYEPLPQGHDYRPQNYDSFESNRHVQRSAPVYDRGDHIRPLEDAVVQQNRIYQVVEQLAQQAQLGRERPLPREEPAEIGSEDGELRTRPVAHPEGRQFRPQYRPVNKENDAAERFLNDFLPGEATLKNGRRELDDTGVKWEPELMRDGLKRIYHPDEQHRRVRNEYEENSRFDPRPRPISSNSYQALEKPPPTPVRTHPHEDRYHSSAPEHVAPREGRSPELVDRRYIQNNVVYRDERQTSHSTHRTPSRYARYESVRLEHDRARSTSPVYVKTGGQPGQYRDHSPAAHLLHQEPVYRTRTPQLNEGYAYERAPRQELYRVYAGEPRPREPEYAEAYEFVRITDSQGEYVIRRPIRREPEPVYAAYENDGYKRQPIYESRAPIYESRQPARQDDGYEEYDPRHPAPPLVVPVQVGRYQ